MKFCVVPWENISWRKKKNFSTRIYFWLVFVDILVSCSCETSIWRAINKQENETDFMWYDVSKGFISKISVPLKKKKIPCWFWDMVSLKKKFALFSFKILIWKFLYVLKWRHLRHYLLVMKISLPKINFVQSKVSKCWKQSFQFKRKFVYKIEHTYLRNIANDICRF